MKVLTGEFLEEWGWKPEYGLADPAHNGKYHPKARISNNHPAILPFTAGTHGSGAHALAVDLYRQGRLRHTAMTYQLGAAEVDAGAVIHEEPVRIYTEDDAGSLEARVREIELDSTAAVIYKHLILRAEHIRGDTSIVQ